MVIFCIELYSMVEPHLMDTEPKMWPSSIANTLLCPKCIYMLLCMMKTLHKNAEILEFCNAKSKCIIYYYNEQY